jgi:hypothetical protein
LPLRSPLGALEGGHEGDARGNFEFLTAMPEKRLPIIFKTVSASDAVQYDANGNVQCASCHNPHLYDLNITHGPFLRKSNTNSGLCMACHDL